MKVRYIIGGGNIATEAIIPDSWSYNSLDLKNIKAIHKRFGKIPINTMPKVSLYRFFYLVMVKKIRIIPILNYLSYKKREATEIIKNELGWREYGSKHFESIYTRFYQGYILREKFKIDKRRAHLATLVCSKEITRGEALEEMKNDTYAQYNLREDKEFVLKKFGLSEEEFQKIMNTSIKEHTDYPNDAFILYKLVTHRNKFKKIATQVE
ncbi:MAG TPA: N-acetyl sugar amidotransferase, partial [Bacteroidia bacterium]|nr:N-acetyl sugar amidotransferase [Bacteroidia bacterium]